MATILSAVRAFRAAALLIESDASRELARLYDRAHAQILIEVERLLAEYLRLAQSGQVPGRAWVLSSERVLAALAAVEFEIGLASRASDRVIASAQSQMLRLATESTRDMLAPITREVFSPPVKAFEKMAGFLGDGSPLSRILNRLPAQARAGVKGALLDGIILGRGPRETARIMRSDASAALAVPRRRALTISRTETMRAHRESSIENYKANREVLRGWVWLCACDLRSCPSCWAMHGTFHDHREVFGSHPNCRCSPAPQVRNMPALIPEDQAGSARFGRLDEDEQREILGPRKFELYRTGRIGLGDMTVKTYDKDWGPQRHEATISEALAKSGNTRKAA